MRAQASRTGVPPLTLILGGVRSGKSRHAERLVLESGLEPVYVATAEARDDEMARRIAAHRARRDGRWHTVEAPLDLADAMREVSRPSRAVLVDCLTLWLTNVMVAERAVADEIRRLLDAVPALPGPVVMVSNEVGLGVVPTNAMARAFADEAGRLHQALAEIADAVVFMAAGLPLSLKSPTDPPSS